jgi:hypothetical protein
MIDIDLLYQKPHFGAAAHTPSPLIPNGQISKEITILGVETEGVATARTNRTRGGKRAK